MIRLKKIYAYISIYIKIYHIGMHNKPHTYPSVVISVSVLCVYVCVHLNHEMVLIASLLSRYTEAQFKIIMMEYGVRNVELGRYLNEVM